MCVIIDDLIADLRKKETDPLVNSLFFNRRISRSHQFIYIYIIKSEVSIIINKYKKKYYYIILYIFFFLYKKT